MPRWISFLSAPQENNMKILLLVIGYLSLALGILGIFLPLLPTVPFLLLTAWCFAKASPRLHQRFLRYRWFRFYIRGYLEGRGVSQKVKWISLTLLWISGLFSVTVLIQPLWAKIVVVVILTTVTVHIVRIPSEKT